VSTEALSVNPSKEFSRTCCPYCGCRYAWRSHRRGLIERHLFRVFRLIPHRCTDCDRRFYARSVISGNDYKD